MRRLALALALCVAVAPGCANSVKPPARPVPLDPETELTYGPLDGDSTYFRVQFYWSGIDKDGEVVRYHFAADAETALSIAEWKSTAATDSIIEFRVGSATAIAAHVFMVSAVDNAGRYDPTPARRFFAAKTIPPTSKIDRGPTGFNPIVPRSFTFEWSGVDPDGRGDGGSASVDSFEYLLLQPGMSAEPGRPELPPFNDVVYTNLINAGTGSSLPAPYDDWKWTGVHASSRHFESVTVGEYVFAERAVDVAGATESSLQYVRNFRRFTVAGGTTVPGRVGPLLSITADLFLRPLSTAIGPVDQPRAAVQIMEGEVVRFSWYATAVSYGGVILGYTYALDDSSQFPAPSLQNTGAVFGRDRLTPGLHTLYVRAVDTDGLVTNAVNSILVVHAAFRDPGAMREILYVDDWQSPGATQLRIGNFPSDVEETDWWTLDLLPNLGVPYTEWDTYLQGVTDVVGRKPPELRDLARYSTVIWNVDLNNGVASPTALYTTLVGSSYSGLAGYLRSGGTLILTGLSIANNTTEPRSTMYANVSQGVCAGVEVGSSAYNLSYFARDFMGLDGARASDAGLRTLGARDFLSAAPTAAGIAAGYDTAAVDRGDLGSGAKWITDPGSGDPNTNRSPGLPQVDGWVMAQDFGCRADASLFRPENLGLPLAQPLLVYHGANKGADEELGPSPREGLVVGIQVQAHGTPPPSDPPYGGPSTLDPNASIGRMVHLAFPLYFLRDQDAVRVLQSAFQYVNASPTLP